MGVEETALTFTITVSPVLYAVVLAVSQMLSALCALTFIVIALIKKNASINAGIGFISNSKKGRTQTCAPINYLRITGSPRQWTGLAIVLREKLKIKHVDRAIIIQICSGRNVRVIAHANRERIELIDCVIPVNITGKQSNRWHGSATRAHGDRSLGTQETTSCGANTVGPGRSRDAKGSIHICVDR